ncbi:MerR family transcriptional regulator [Mycobacterium sp. SM1]|uniref:chaperone modulator CbpM n=1 Tax=Mycobacterium sp. SM1 TaxID=2816243 RepID=UPI001BCEE8F7|nr:chaperone modulator CbpM [Mycobacterium sp. SM1]MBS4729273.1 MerR family transcriptional regulator [Mycobacterium sp. SM1]
MSTPGSSSRYVPARVAGLSLDSFAHRAGLHPDIVRRYVAPGLLRCRIDSRWDMWFEPADLAVIPRIQRLRVGLGLNYTAIGLVLDLLDRVDALESASDRRRTSPWTSTV